LDLPTAQVLLLEREIPGFQVKNRLAIAEIAGLTRGAGKMRELFRAISARRQI